LEEEMLTKKELCEAMLIKYAHANLAMNGPIDLTKIPESVCMSSTTVGICMEYLGLIKDPSIKKYISHRGGVFMTTFDKEGNPTVISFRQVLESMKD
jgi:hypothetical protein